MNEQLNEQFITLLGLMLSAAVVVIIATKLFRKLKKLF
jgi:hypothetical protein